MIKTGLFRGNQPQYDAPIGSPEATTYKYVIDKDTGRRKWKENGKTNIYEKIQASLEQSKLVNIIRRATADPSVLNVMAGNWVDITEMPNTLMEAQNMVIQCKQQFDELPIEVRRKFDFDAEYYVSMYGSEMWADALGYTTPKEVAKAVEEKKVEVNTDEH